MSAFFPYDISPRFSTEFNLLFGCIYSRWIGRQHLHTPKGRERDVLTYSIPSSIFGGFFFLSNLEGKIFTCFLSRDAAVYALGVGACGRNAIDSDELKYVYHENGQQFVQVNLKSLV
jgi:hypothetical protein